MSSGIACAPCRWFSSSWPSAPIHTHESWPRDIRSWSMSSSACGTIPCRNECTPCASSCGACRMTACPWSVWKRLGSVSFSLDGFTRPAFTFRSYKSSRRLRSESSTHHCTWSPLRVFDEALQFF